MSINLDRIQQPLITTLPLRIDGLGPIPDFSIKLSNSLLKNDEMLNLPTLNRDRIKEITLLENCSEEEIAVILDTRVDSLSQLFAKWIKNEKWTSLLNLSGKFENSHLLILKSYAAGLIDEKEVATAFIFLDLKIRFQDKAWRIEKDEKCTDESIPLNQRYSFVVKNDSDELSLMSELIGQGRSSDEVLFPSYPNLLKKIEPLKNNPLTTVRSDWKLCLVYKLSEPQNMIHRLFQRCSDVGLTVPGTNPVIHGGPYFSVAVILHDLGHNLLRCGIPKKEIDITASLALEISHLLQSMPEYSAEGTSEGDEGPTGEVMPSSKATIDDIYRNALEHTQNLIIDGGSAIFPELREADADSYRKIILEKTIVIKRLLRNSTHLNDKAFIEGIVDRCITLLDQKMSIYQRIALVFEAASLPSLCI